MIAHSELSVSVLIPTVSGRETFLEMCVTGYLRNTPAWVDLEFVILRDRLTCGVGWQEAAERASGTYLHFSNDDIVPRTGWLEPLVHAALCGYVVAPWIQHGDWGGFYGAAPGVGQEDDWQDVDHSAMPFCERERFKRVGPIIATHYGVDNWFAERVRAAGMRLVGRRESVLDHWNIQIGREKGDWTQVDLLDYDCGIALPEYRAGVRPPTEMPPDRLTPEGLARARQWRKENVL
jgi:hypothetical protein